jgi:hypothetical protein
MHLFTTAYASNSVVELPGIAQFGSEQVSFLPYYNYSMQARNR